LCRNVTIYFSPLSAERLYERLAARLAPGGWLVLGPSDPPPSQTLLERAQLSVVLESRATLFRKVAATISLESAARAIFPAAQPPVIPRAVVTPIARVSDSAQQALIDGLVALEREPQRALEHLRRAAYLEPRDAVIQFAKARAFDALNEPRRAWAALRQAERILEGIPDGITLRLNTRVAGLRVQLEGLKGKLEEQLLRE
jgi:hypothetical protein